MTVDSIREFHKGTGTYKLHAGTLQESEFGTHYITVGPFEADHHYEDTIAEFHNEEHDAEFWSKYFADSPEMIDILLKRIEELEIENAKLKNAAV